MLQNRWFLFVYQLPAKPSTQRVYAWRRLKAVGAVYLFNSVCFLPDAPGTKQALEELKSEIKQRKGEALILDVTLNRPEEVAELRQKFMAQSDEDYKEFLGKCEDFHKELANERRNKHFSFAELEENEEEIKKLRAWLPKIQGRDYFKASLTDNAVSALAGCEKDFAKFCREVEKIS